MNEKKENKFENAYIKIREEEGILYCEFADNLEVTLEVAKVCVAARIGFSKEKSYPALIYMKGIKSVTKEAREYMAKEGVQLLTAGALVISSPLSKVIGNLFLRINKPPIPTQIFTNEKEAKKWLKKHF